MKHKNLKKSKNKMSVAETILRFIFGFLFPFIIINGTIFFLFIQVPTIEIANTDSESYEQDKIKFKVTSLLPITEIKAIKNEEILPYTKFNNYYIVDAKENGSYTISAKSLNGAISNSYITIETKDETPPTIDTENVILTSDSILISIKDDNSEINYDNVYATLADGSTIYPIAIEKTSGVVTFKYEAGQKITIHVEDVNGNYSETTIS